MYTISDDLLGEEFRRIWNGLAAAGVTPLAVAGGYGLLLKQQSLRARNEQDMLVPLERWKDPVPRTTKDLDFVIDLDFIRGEAEQKKMVNVLSECGFQVTEDNPRWQFEKALGSHQRILVEFHAQTPQVEMQDLVKTRKRVRRKRSLHENGIHAYHNPEAVGCKEHAVPLEVDGAVILLPNAVTWSIMKLTAMADRYVRSREGDRSEKDRTFFLKQAEKHAADVCRIVAMISRSEAESSGGIALLLKDEPAFIRASEIVREHFSTDDGWALMVTEGSWEASDLGEIRGMLGSWFA